MGRACSTNGHEGEEEESNIYKVLIVKPKGRRPLGRHERRWEYNIKMDLREIGFCGLDWIHPTHERENLMALVNTVLKLWFP
jgi:hypothetical protein